MKIKLFILLVVNVIFSVYVFSQDAVSLVEPASDGFSKKQDKGKSMENGLFFIKSFYEEVGKDVPSIESTKKQLSKTFEMEIEKSGNYFFAAHILPANNIEKLARNRSIEEKELDDKVDILEVRVYLNGQLIGTLNQTKLDWELVALKKEKTVHLETGKNIIRFESDAPYYPMVDAVRITESEKDLMFKNDKYDDFIVYLKSNPNRTLPAEKETQDEVDRKARENVINTNTPGLRSAMFPGIGDWDWQLTPHPFPCPECIYASRANVPITYTYYRKLSLSAGSYTFNTAPISGDTYYSVDPVMYLYKINDPHTYSWENDDDSGYGYQSRISVSNIPAGDYYLVIRAYNSSYASSALGRQGLVNVYQNGSILNSSVPVAGSMFDVSHHTSNRNLLNYFTAYTTGIPVIWLLQNVSSNAYKMKFYGATFFYLSPMDFQWFDDARMQLTKNSADTYSMLVSAEGAMGFYFGNCDAYGNIESKKPFDPNNPNVSYFPNLKLADAMISAPFNTNYNCHAWSGGIHTQWFDDVNRQGIISGYNYGSVFVWSTWDNYFGNNPSRYSGATTYTRNQAHAGNAEIALWSYDGTISGVSHTSVRLLANNNPHGYDWESKCGPLQRIFHPRNALNGSKASGAYGNIIDYYRDASKAPNAISVYSATANPDNNERTNILALRSAQRLSYEPVFMMEESIEKGLTIIEEVTLDAEQLSLVRSKSAMLSTSVLQTFYDNWVKKIKSPEMSHISSVYSYIETEEGKQLIDYAKNNLEESIVFFANVVFTNEEATFEKYIAEYLFCEIAKDKYAPVIEKIKEDWASNSYDKSGRYIAPMPETFAKKYIKELLNKAVLRSEEVSNQSADKLIDNDFVATISPNPVYENSNVNLNLKNKTIVTIRVYTQNASLVGVILNNRVLEAGAHSFSLNAGNLRSGVYICVIEIDGIPYSRKFLKR